MLGGPGIINGEITMNGLGNAVAAVDAGVTRVGQSVDALQTALQAIKAELDQMNTRLQTVERLVTPKSEIQKTLGDNQIFIQHK